MCPLAELSTLTPQTCYSASSASDQVGASNAAKEFPRSYNVPNVGPRRFLDECIIAWLLKKSMFLKTNSEMSEQKCIGGQRKSL